MTDGGLLQLAFFGLPVRCVPVENMSMGQDQDTHLLPKSEDEDGAWLCNPAHQEIVSATVIYLHAFM